jgi:hypothetical protein
VGVDLKHDWCGAIVAFAGGALAAIGGIAVCLRPDFRLRRAMGGLGAMLTLSAEWLLVGGRSTTQRASGHPLLLARPGPGLFVVAVALLLTALLFYSTRRYDNAH